MNPFATSTIAGHAPRKSDGEHEEREHAENRASTGRIAKMRTEREDDARRYIRVHSMKRRKRWTKERRGRKRERKRRSEGRQKK